MSRQIHQLVISLVNRIVILMGCFVGLKTWGVSSRGKCCWSTWCSNMGFHWDIPYTKRRMYEFILLLDDCQLQAVLLVGRLV